MSLLSELSAIAKKLKIPAQTSVYSGKALDEYLVFTPLYDSFELHADNAPTADVQEVRISLFTKSSYTRTVSMIVKALLSADITVPPENMSVTRTTRAIIIMPLIRRKTMKWRIYKWQQ